MKYITNMLRKDNEIKWNPKARKAFSYIKKALTKDHVLNSPDYSKYF